MSSTHEDTVTGMVVEYLRQHDLNALNHTGIEIPDSFPKEPDYEVRNDGIFLGEAKWEDDYFQAIAEARDYGLAPTANGTFAIAYPDDLQEEVQQARIGESGVETVLSGYNYRVAFLRRDEQTEMDNLTIEEIPDWLDDQIHRKREPETDPKEAINVLQQTSNSLTRELEDIESPDLFRNVLGVEPKETDRQVAGKRAAGFLLVNQITFYRVLSHVADYPEIDPDSLTTPEDLLDYFAEVLEDDYRPIFSFPVVQAYGQEHLPLLKRAIKAIYGLTPEQIDHEVLGTVFHKLTPLSVRKPLAAFYTQKRPAEILSRIAVNDESSTVLDPACGSGTILNAAYRRKQQLTTGFDDEDHRRFLEEEITGIDIMPFAAHLSTIHLALENPRYQTDTIRIGITDSTSIEPGDEVPPMVMKIPESVQGQKGLSDFNGEREWRQEENQILGGAVSLEGFDDTPLELDSVDLVMMNPPFTRQESVADFGSDSMGKSATLAG